MTHTRGITRKVLTSLTSSSWRSARRSHLSGAIRKPINSSIAQCGVRCFGGFRTGSSSKWGQERLSSTPCSMARGTRKVGGDADETHKNQPPQQNLWVVSGSGGPKTGAYPAVIPASGPGPLSGVGIWMRSVSGIPFITPSRRSCGICGKHGFPRAGNQPGRVHSSSSSWPRCTYGRESAHFSPTHSAEDPKINWGCRRGAR